MPDFKDIKERVRIESCIPMLGLVMKQQGPQYRGPCPACKAGGDRALAINSEKAGYYCFSEGKGGDCIALVGHIKGLSAKDAAQFLEDTIAPKRPQPTEGFRTLDLDPDHAAVEAIGFDAAIATKLGIGYCSKGMLKGMVAIPVRTNDGVLFGYIGIDEAKLPASFRGTNITELKTG